MPSRFYIGSPQQNAAGSFLRSVARLIRSFGGDVGRFSGAALLLFRSSGITIGSRPMGRVPDWMSGCVPLSLEKKPAAKKSSFGRPSVVASFCLHRAGCPAVRIRTGSFPLGSNGVGALLATESYDLRVLANRTILHVAAGHPSLRFGRAVFFRDSGLRAPASVSLLRIARFQSGHIP